MTFFGSERFLMGRGVESDCDIYFSWYIWNEAVDEVGNLVLSRENNYHPTFCY